VRKVLYIVSKRDSLRPDLVLSTGVAEQDISVLLIQDAVSLTNVPSPHVFALADDAASRNITPVFPTVSYRDMVRLMFEADTVIAL
jgi:sulfur transfer complex TusBCD TusB component (DsrH family)